MLGQGVRVALVGNSHMEALGPRLARLLPARTGVSVVRTEARRGWSTRAYLRSGDLPRLAEGADVVVIELGGNDAAAGISAADHARDVQAAVQAVSPKKVIWVGPTRTQRPDLEVFRGPIRDVQPGVVRELGHAWVDSQPLTVESALRADGVHYTAAGYDKWADKLAKKLAVVSAGGGNDMVWIGPVVAGAAGIFALAAWGWSRRR